MAIIGMILQLVASVAGLVCFIMVLIKMFQNDQTTLGIVCIVTAVLCCGIGGLIAFVMGWVKSSEWDTKQVMLIWTGAIVASLIGGLLNPVDFSQFQQLQQFQNP